MGEQKKEPELFNYGVNLEKRVRSDHPLRRVAAAIDFSFVREEVAPCYGSRGNVSVDPEVILKMMFLLFFDDVASERELMKIIAERLDYLWFLGYGLDEEIPDHSVLSKARARWGQEVFESLFVRTVMQCVAAGLVDGRKLHLDSSLIEADAAKESVIKGAPELIATLKRAYRATESKLAETTTPESYQAVNDRMMSVTDPDAALVRRGSGDVSRPRYHHHRAIDDEEGGDHRGRDNPWQRGGEQEALGLNRAASNQYWEASADGGGRPQVWDAGELRGLRRAWSYQSYG